MNILIVEPFFAGSHASWAKGFARRSRHDVHILRLSGAHWKWRMHGGAVTLSRQFVDGQFAPDLIVATDMLDLTTFLALTRRHTADIATAMYFHENQLTYPWSKQDRDLKRDRDRHYSFINFASALSADRVFFNSHYHRDSFLGELPQFLRQFPDHQELGQVEHLANKSEVLPLGFDLLWFDDVRTQQRDSTVAAKERGDKSRTRPLILWNHRWEYDKNPEEFFEALNVVSSRGRSFDVAILGEAFDVTPQAFDQGMAALGKRVVHVGFARDMSEYARWLWRADVLPVTSNQDFFGGSVMEALYCACFPILPRRLAYPELIPQELHASCFYDDFDGLVQMLDEVLTKEDGDRATPFREVAARYDWGKMAPVYDSAFEDLVARK